MHAGIVDADNTQYLTTIICNEAAGKRSSTPLLISFSHLRYTVCTIHTLENTRATMVLTVAFKSTKPAAMKQKNIFAPTSGLLGILTMAACIFTLVLAFGTRGFPRIH